MGFSEQFGLLLGDLISMASLTLPQWYDQGKILANPQQIKS